MLVQFTMYTDQMGVQHTGDPMPASQLDKVTDRYWDVVHEEGPWVVVQSDMTDRQGKHLTVAAYRFEPVSLVKSNERTHTRGRAQYYRSLSLGSDFV